MTHKKTFRGCALFLVCTSYFFDFLQSPNISYVLEGDTERWYLFQGFYISMTVNTNDRNRPLIFSFGPNIEMAANVTITCWEGDTPNGDVFFIPTSCNGTCNGCANRYYPESMACPSSGNVLKMEFILLTLLLTLFFCFLQPI